MSVDIPISVSLNEPLCQILRHRLLPAQHATDVWAADAEQLGELVPP
jgi:hypothetical protein